MFMSSHANRHAARTTSFLRSHRLSSRLSSLVIVALAAMLVLVACADDTADRQFASDPRTSVATPSIAAEPPGTSSPVAVPIESSPEALVDRRGAPDYFYAYNGGVLRSFGMDGADVIHEGSLEGFDASPSGHRVALVTAMQQTDASVFSIDVYDHEGSREVTFEDVVSVEANQSTPDIRTELSSVIDISWAPQGGHLLLATAEGEIIDLPLGGEPVRVETRTPLPGIIQADWSPAGDSIGVLTRDEQGRGELAIVDTTANPGSVNVIAPSGERTGGEKSVEQFAWRANGAGVLFLEFLRRDSGLADGKIFDWDMATNTSAIVATGAQVGPTGSVTSFSVAPDGKALLYTVSIVQDRTWSFSGLYVRSLANGRVYEIPVAADGDVSGSWWARKGVAWAQNSTPDNANAITRVYMVRADGLLVELDRFATTPASTPDARPAGVATPVGATPVATPFSATPVGGTPESATPVGTPGGEATPAGTPIIIRQ